MPTESAERIEYTLLDLVFVGFNRRVVALDRYTGDTVWDWRSPAGTGFPALLVDGDRLIVSVQGYMYCLDPLSGEVWWSNPLKGLGVGTACIASLHGNSGSAAAAAVIAQQQQQAAASGASASV